MNYLLQRRTSTSLQIASIRLSGRFDVHAVQGFRNSINDIFLYSPVSLIIDLSNVNFIDSASLAILLKSMKRFQEEGGDLILCNLSNTVKIIFELTKMDKVFKIYSSQNEAVNATHNRFEKVSLT